MIGNSHLGVVRQAWRENLSEKYPEIRPTFFGVAGQGMSTAYVHDGVIRTDDQKVADSFAKTSGGAKEVYLGNFDTFVFYGVGFPLKMINAFLSRDKDSNDRTDESVSLERVMEQVRQFIGNHPVIKIAFAVRKASPKPIFLCMAPMWSILEKEAVGHQYKTVTDHGSEIKKLFFQVLENSLHPHNIEIIPQVDDTLHEPLFTKREFLMGYASNNIKDYGHMNIDYGRLVVERLIRQIKGDT